VVAAITSTEFTNLDHTVVYSQTVYDLAAVADASDVLVSDIGECQVKANLCSR